MCNMRSALIMLGWFVVLSILNARPMSNDVQSGGATSISPASGTSGIRASGSGRSSSSPSSLGTATIASGFLFKTRAGADSGIILTGCGPASTTSAG